MPIKTTLFVKATQNKWHQSFKWRLKYHIRGEFRILTALCLDAARPGGCTHHLSIDTSSIHRWGVHSYYKLSRHRFHQASLQRWWRRLKIAAATLGTQESAFFLKKQLLKMHCRFLSAHSDPRWDVLPTPIARIPAIFVDMNIPISSHFKASGGCGMLPRRPWMERRDKAALNHSGMISCPLLMSLGVIALRWRHLMGVRVCVYMCVYRVFPGSGRPLTLPAPRRALSSSSPLSTGQRSPPRGGAEAHPPCNTTPGGERGGGAAEQFA